jgi:transposase InsO family protein
MSVRYTRRVKTDEKALKEAIRRLASRHLRYGYRRITLMLRREGWAVNIKRIHRLWKMEGLAIRRKARKRRASGPSPDVLMKAQRPGHVWSYDFLEDRTERGGKLRMLTVLDEFTRESLAIRVDRSINSHKVMETLDWLFLVHGAPEHLRSDNGPEFIAKALQKWIGERGATTLYITPGSPWENGYNERFNGTLRREVLNAEWFTTIDQAKTVIGKWLRQYNHIRPHQALKMRPPVPETLSKIGT